LLLTFLLVPAAFQTAPPVPKSLEPLLEALDAIPGAFIDGRDERIQNLICKARKHWEPLKAQGVAGVPAHDLDLAGQRLLEMANLRPRHQAEAALEMATLLSVHFAAGRLQIVQACERTAMLAWCRVEAGRWDTLPDLPKALAPVLEGDHGGHRRAFRQIQAGLADWKEATAARSVSAAKRTLEGILDDLEALERPRD
jgi:hypothetical protein